MAWVDMRVQTIYGNMKILQRLIHIQRLSRWKHITISGGVRSYTNLELER